ncbi:hypothetical protein X768_23210 [Mesorhizobium sp. LSJC265A00]|uniref:hypothetical protein n=1 Tax=Mesorhizobium sp. LSJC265A00 TaxID=1287322 RepID=UPI0003CE0029|nr:hypothetical protein [Mesorhizobium sp. LSJC265A00]ESX08379.1 hypothetical protein X768_23210 [Mesorhizobium sp. LSJC265A00]
MIGIDDWAWRRNQRYGTLICDLERRKTIALLPDGEPATARAWLSDQLQIGSLCRADPMFEGLLRLGCLQKVGRNLTKLIYGSDPVH